MTGIRRASALYRFEHRRGIIIRFDRLDVVVRHL
jgi:hypothetical protein